MTVLFKDVLLHLAQLALDHQVLCLSLLSYNILHRIIVKNCQSLFVQFSDQFVHRFALRLVELRLVMFERRIYFWSQIELGIVRFHCHLLDNFLRCLNLRLRDFVFTFFLLRPNYVCRALRNLFILLLKFIWLYLGASAREPLLQLLVNFQFLRYKLCLRTVF